MTSQHELTSYSNIVLFWEDAMRGTPWNDLETCRKMSGSAIDPRSVTV